ncbi:hypothetical protein VOLCADRAFT_99438 [Volvox carteri f. nagariensis]|uniref:Uncharacterized protein n=1 Tax=Volvox carteri f. nagariensis TaxID=3068 RepID=D8UHT2_VOLCA|nr:uncharacterized protein VOLCADRAFT_99438 [Volvox carteri f. nagariensis]EFJ40740.1 hypothetical protein VOLCADRAFT_99438 [Volvox carteri f. nagariensis]|eukprot:XP_002958206.1 hypothetical protein VOLCADRAFT_99438 [Volvox carteri f. nagariensis]
MDTRNAILLLCNVILGGYPTDAVVRVRELTVGNPVNGTSLLGYKVQFLRTDSERVRVSVPEVPESPAAYVLMSDRGYTASVASQADSVYQVINNVLTPPRTVMLSWLTPHVGADVAEQVVAALSKPALEAAIVDIGRDKKK